MFNELCRFYDNTGRVPTFHDMRKINGYIDRTYYIKKFGTWIDVLEHFKFISKTNISYTKSITPRPEYTKSNTYTPSFLIDELHRFSQIYKRSPKLCDMLKSNGFPSYNVYIKNFGSWNNALKIADLKLNQKHNRDNIKECSVCHTNESKHWYFNNDDIICVNCYSSVRGFIRGTLDPDSNVGNGIISEHIVCCVLQDCVKCNNIDDFHSKVDLISQSLGMINVKSSKLKISKGKYYFWNFRKHLNQTIPDYYICLGFDEYRNEIQHVWVIPNDANIIAKHSIAIVPNNLERAIKYEVDPTPYNEVYQNLDIYSLSEFYNLKQNEVTA